MAVAMGADERCIVKVGQQCIESLQQVPGQGVVVGFVFRNDKAVADQCDGFMAEGVAVEARTMLKRTGGGNGVHATKSPSHDQEIVQVVEFRSVPALTRVEGKSKALVLIKTFLMAVDDWRDNRQLMFCQFEAKAMFFENLCVGPAFRTIKFSNQRLAIFNPDLVNTVFVAVQGEGAAVADKTAAFHRVHDEGWCQFLKGMLSERFCHEVFALGMS